MPCEKTLMGLRLNGTPREDRTASCPEIALSTGEGSKTSPPASCNRSCRIGNASGCRVKAVTAWPSVRACRTRSRPVAPLAPKHTMFTVWSLPYGHSSNRSSTPSTQRGSLLTRRCQYRHSRPFGSVRDLG